MSILKTDNRESVELCKRASILPKKNSKGQTYFSYEEVKSVKSFLIDDYIVSIASVAENIKIIDAEDIGLRNIINQIKAWMHIWI